MKGGEQGASGLLEASIGSPPATPRSPSHPGLRDMPHVHPGRAASGGEGDAATLLLRGKCLSSWRRRLPATPSDETVRRTGRLWPARSVYRIAPPSPRPPSHPSGWAGGVERSCQFEFRLSWRRRLPATPSDETVRRTGRLWPARSVYRIAPPSPRPPSHPSGWAGGVERSCQFDFRLSHRGTSRGLTLGRRGPAGSPARGGGGGRGQGGVGTRHESGEGRGGGERARRRRRRTGGRARRAGGGARHHC
jgi:hypothetical protein